MPATSHQAVAGVPSVAKENPEDNPTACPQQEGSKQIVGGIPGTWGVCCVSATELEALASQPALRVQDWGSAGQLFLTQIPPLKTWRLLGLLAVAPLQGATHPSRCRHPSGTTRTPPRGAKQHQQGDRREPVAALGMMDGRHPAL